MKLSGINANFRSIVIEASRLDQIRQLNGFNVFNSTKNAKFQAHLTSYDMQGRNELIELLSFLQSWLNLDGKVRKRNQT